MAFIFYKDWNPQHAAWQLVQQCNDVLDGDLAGYRVTLRQLYYQLVSRNIIPNTLASYNRLSGIVTRARLAAMMDWDRVEDRGRRPQAHPEFADLAELTEAAIRSYRLPRWAEQSYYVELWVEKDALASVLLPLAYKYHITLMVNRGYSSASAMKAAADRFIAHSNTGQQCVLLYLGDHDPSGEDMVRDIDERLALFRALVDVRKVALTYEQVEEYQPPPNPAKFKDPRAAAYIAKYGTSSWEVDALHPGVLTEIIDIEVQQVLDEELMDRVREREDYDVDRLRRAVAELTAKEE